MSNKKPVRVSRENRCPICGKPDWCMIGEAYVLCMRVQSDKPKALAGGETGWLHYRGEHPQPVPENKEPERPLINVASLLNEWSNDQRGSRLPELSVKLGVTVESLESLGCVHAPYHNTWAFPMRTGDNSYCGIRLRNLQGEKWAQRGSHSGLFIPQLQPPRRVLIVEGPTDCAAALSIGYYAIGRPSCCGGVGHILEFLRRKAVCSALIVADLDDPGLRGAKGLQELLPVNTAILVCPAKDLRGFVNHGGNHDMLESMVSQLIWRKPLLPKK